MKTKIVALLVALVFVLTGCGSVQAEYWAKMKEASTWETTEVAQTGEMVIDLFGEAIEVAFSTTGVVNQSTLSAHLVLDMAMTMPESFMVGVEELANPLAFQMEMYMDQGNVYLNKGYFEQMFALMGEEVPEVFTALDATYIGIAESNEMMDMMMQMMGGQFEADAIYTAYEAFAALIGLDIEVVKVDDTYSINLDKAQMVNLIKTLLTSVDLEEMMALAYNMVGTMEEGTFEAELVEVDETADVVEIVEGLQLVEALETEDEMAALLGGMTTEEMLEVIDTWAELLDANFTWDTTFGEGQQVDHMYFYLGMVEEMAMMFGSNMSITMTLDQTTTQVETVEMTLPEGCVELTEEELYAALGEVVEELEAVEEVPEA